MSEIACNFCFGIPFLFSDLLFSSQQRPVSIDLPTSNIDLGPHLTLEYPYYPQGLTQKMYIIKGRTCIVFAGREDEIKEFLTEFKVRCSYFTGDVPLDRITEFMDEYPFPQKFARSALFLLHATGSHRDQKVHFGLFNVPKGTHLVDPTTFDIEPGVWNVLDSPTFGKVYAAASGTKRYLNLINQFPNLQTTAEKGSLDYAIQANGLIAAQLLTLEKVALYTLNHLWGGGFEVGYFDGEVFQKFTNIAYIVNHGQFDPSGDVGIPVPRAVMFYRYVGDLLHITAIEIIHGEAYTGPDVVKFTARADQIVVRPFLVPPVDFDRHQRPPEVDLSFKTNLVGMGYSLVTPDNGIFNPAFFKWGPQVYVEYNHEDKIEIYIHPGYIGEIRSGAKATFPRLTNGQQ